MSIDLNACTGCGSCIVSFVVLKTTFAVVGRDEVRTRREMHWIRIAPLLPLQAGMRLPMSVTRAGYTKENAYDNFSGEDFENVSVTYMPMPLPAVRSRSLRNRLPGIGFHP